MLSRHHLLRGASTITTNRNNTNDDLGGVDREIQVDSSLGTRSVMEMMNFR